MFRAEKRPRVSAFYMFYFFILLLKRLKQDEQRNSSGSLGNGGHYGHGLGGLSLCFKPQGIRSSSIRWEDDPGHPAEFGLDSCLGLDRDKDCPEPGLCLSVSQSASQSCV